MNPNQQLIESFVDILIKENGSDLHLSAGRFPSIRASTELITLVNQKKLTPEDMAVSYTHLTLPTIYSV